MYTFLLLSHLHDSFKEQVKCIFVKAEFAHKCTYIYTYSYILYFLHLFFYSVRSTAYNFKVIFNVHTCWKLCLQKALLQTKQRWYWSSCKHFSFPSYLSFVSIWPVHVLGSCLGLQKGAMGKLIEFRWRVTWELAISYSSQRIKLFENISQYEKNISALTAVVFFVWF